MIKKRTCVSGSRKDNELEMYQKALEYQLMRIMKKDKEKRGRH